MTRAEHIQWCKDRALDYWREGDLASAVSSMCSDYGKGPEAKEMPPVLAQLGMLRLMREDRQGVHDWIVGFN